MRYFSEEKITYNNFFLGKNWIVAYSLIKDLKFESE